MLGEKKEPQTTLKGLIFFEDHFLIAELSLDEHQGLQISRSWVWWGKNLPTNIKELGQQNMGVSAPSFVDYL